MFARITIQTLQWFIGIPVGIAIIIICWWLYKFVIFSLLIVVAWVLKGFEQKY